MSLIPARRVVLLAALIATPGCSAPFDASGERTPVEIWRAGDDGLTVRVGESLEKVFRNEARFVLSSGNKPGTLRVIIPTNLSWKEASGQTQVSYIVQFTGPHSELLGTNQGTCLEIQLEDCSNRVLVAAKNLLPLAVK